MIPPHKTIGEDYLLRWHLIPRNRWCNVYLHRFTGSDDARACHDHPWWSVSLLLRGLLEEIYLERGRERRRVIPWLRPVHRPADFAHRLLLRKGPAWTLFITGPRVRSWGFHCPNGWRHWSTMATRDGQMIGGCE